MSVLDVFASLPQDHFLCPICLNVFSDPVTTPCGHNFCKTCLVQTGDDADEFCQCPTCKKRFNRTSEFSTNTFIAEISTQIKKRRVEAAETPDAPWKVKCDVCTDFKMKASKSCLGCVTSYCDAHLEPHQRVPSLMRHKLIDPVENLEERMCGKHRMILELFCRDEQVCVCLLCSETEHKGHETVPVPEEAARQKETIESRKAEVNKMIQDRMGKIAEITSSSDLTTEKCITEMDACNELFNTLVNKVQEKQTALAMYIENRLAKSMSKNESVVKELQEEIAELQRKHSELEELEHNEDHFQFLLALRALSRASNAKDLLQLQVYSDLYVQTTRRALSHLMLTFQAELKTLTGMELTRMRQYKEAVNFDPSTAGIHLAVTDYDTRLKRFSIARSPTCPGSNRFQLSMVFGKEGFTSGRHYWEVQVGLWSTWDVGVAKESVPRTQNVITKKNGFFTIGKRGGEYKAYHSFYEVINLSPRPRKIGVYVDCEEGRVSFYEIDQKLHIYTYKKVPFTEKLFPCFYLYSKAKKSEPMIILPIRN
ncbi:probable E3 ubiquitin-protein ligase TRIML1 [Salarias fasciatus]|uniref:probable E3 ubiquitin-protein ligase TRIML1 n=1 Tax=Salarias fasciatus TaxID=181472 RepID=UPI0011769498|nr:probable E3 ubiquitin-protein ligase TRIML1 [Salarias fasciatus]